MSAAGPILFARFAYPPNQLGYCGPDDAAAVLEYATAVTSDPGLRQLAAGFDGAWPYLELIAGAAGVADPLDRRVVEAYWIGSPLLERVDTAAMATSMTDRFRRRAGGSFDDLMAPVPLGCVPHHSFHVFAVYPWLGLLRAGMHGRPLEVLDRCRIRWGRVLTVAASTAIVESRPLQWDGARLLLGTARPEQVQVASAGRGLAEPISPGDWVAMHWDWVCERLDRRRLAALRHYTLRHLAAVAESPRPAPAAVLG